MSPEVARRRAGALLGAALGFVALAGLAAWLYPGGSFVAPSARGFDHARNFLSDLGATTTWSGEDNTPSAVVFAVALAGLGAALAAFAPAWPAFAFARGRARRAGVAARWCGAGSGAALVGVAAAPVDVAPVPHAVCVATAFALLLGYVAALAVVAWRNGARRGALALDAACLVTAALYLRSMYAWLALVDGPVSDARWVEVVVAQKVAVGVALLHVVHLAALVRRRLAPART